MRRALRAAVLATGSLAIIGLVALLAWGLSNKSPASGLSGITLVQQPAPDFTLPLFTSGELVLSELRGRPLVLNFWASWCVPCREEAPGLERAWRAFREKQVMFIGLDIQEGESSAKAYLDEFQVTYPNGLDADGKITIDYGVVGIPVTFFVNKRGIIERRFVGAIDESQLFDWVEGLVSGQPLSGETEGSNLDRFFTLEPDD